ncbi:MAG: hypothetical protein ABI402_07750 [Ferruginibacter sp.]
MSKLKKSTKKIAISKQKPSGKNKSSGIRNLSLEKKISAKEAAPNFTFSFQRIGVTVLSLHVESFQQSMPPDAGIFFVPILDPSDEPEIRVTVIARQDSPGGSGSLSLKFNGKDVYSPSRDFDFKGGMGGITELIKLPK